MEDRGSQSNPSSVLDPPFSPSRWHSVAVFLILAAAIALAWCDSFGPGADRRAEVNWTLDNRYIIAGDPRLRATQWDDASGQPGLANVFTRDYWWPSAPSGLYRPVVTISYWLNWQATASDGSSDDAAQRRQLAIFHAANLLAHLILTFLVYHVVLLVTGRWWPAAAAALLFGLHPINAESVTNLVGRADEFAAIGVLGGLLLYARATRASGAKRVLWLTALGLITLFGVFSKESAVAIVGVLLLYDLLIRSEADSSPPRSARLLGYVSLLPAVVLLLIARRLVFADNPPPPTAFVDNPIIGTSWLGGRITALHVLAEMWKLFAWPMRLTCDYSFNQVPVALSPWSTPSQNAVAIASAVLVLGVFVAAVVAAVRWPKLRPLAFFVLFFFVTSFVTSNLAFPIGAIMAERFAYLPLVGFVASIAIVLDWLLVQRGRTGRSIATLAVVALATFYGVRTWQRNRDWRSDLALWKSALDTSPNSFRTYQSYSYALFEELRKPAAQRQPEAKDVTIDDCIAACAMGEPIVASLPDELNFTRIRLQLGMFYAMKGDFERAVAQLEQARRADQAVNALNRRDAVARGRSPAEIADGGNAEIYANLGYACARLGRWDEALASYEYQRHLNPQNADVYERIAQAQFKSNRPADAAATLMQELFLDSSRRTRVEPLLQTALRAASAEPEPTARTALISLTRIFLNARLPSQADQIRKIGLNRGIPAAEFDAIYREFGRSPGS